LIARISTPGILLEIVVAPACLPLPDKGGWSNIRFRFSGEQMVAIVFFITTIDRARFREFYDQCC